MPATIESPIRTSEGQAAFDRFDRVTNQIYRPQIARGRVGSNSNKHSDNHVFVITDDNSPYQREFHRHLQEQGLLSNLHRASNPLEAASAIYKIAEADTKRQIEKLGILDLRTNLNLLKTFLSTELEKVFAAMSMGGINPLLYLGTNAPDIKNEIIRTESTDVLMPTEKHDSAKEYVQAIDNNDYSPDPNHNFHNTMFRPANFGAGDIQPPPPSFNQFLDFILKQEPNSMKRPPVLPPR